MITSFRKVSSDEIDAAYAAYMSVFDWLNAKGVRQWLRPLSKEIFTQRQRDGQLFALHVEDRLVAVVTIAFEASDYWSDTIGQDQYWWIKSLAVVRKWKGAGFGKHIMVDCEAFVREAGAAEVHLDCVDIGFLPPYYADLGYEVVERKKITYPSGNSFPMVLMRKRMPNQSAEPIGTAVTCCDDARPAPAVPMAHQ